MSSSTVKTLTRPLRLLFHPHIGAPAVGESSPLINGQLAVVPTPAFQFYYAFSSSASTTIPSSVGGGTALAASSSPHSQDIQRGIWSKLLLFVPGAVTFGLGTWQIFRREEKIKMLDYRKGRLDLEPIKLTSTSSTENLDDLEFRRVVCRGSFDEKRSIFVGPRSRSISGVTNNGYYVITPLMPVPGDPGSVQSPVLVNRGWVPQSWRDDLLEASKMHEQPTNASPPASKVERTSWWRSWFRKPERDEEQASVTASVEVVGVVRGSEKPSIFVPANDSHSGQWFYIDVPAIVRSCSLPENTIYVENINANVNHSHPYPVPKDVNSLIRSSVMPQDHLNYTLTWYSLSAAVTFMAFKRIRPKKSRNRK
ncbi:Surfeit locus protein 1 [Dionaea muscipula]